MAKNLDEIVGCCATAGNRSANSMSCCLFSISPSMAYREETFVLGKQFRTLAFSLSVSEQEGIARVLPRVSV